MLESRKVLIFIKGLDIGGYSGGADLFGINLAGELRKQDCKVVLCACHQYRTEAEKERVNSLRINNIEPIFLIESIGSSSLKGYLHALRKLYRIVNDQKVQIIHSHFQAGTLLSIFLKLSGKVRWVVRTAHIDQEWRRGWHGFTRQAIIRMLFFLIYPLFVNIEIGVSRSCVEGLNQRLVSKILSKVAILIPNAVLIPESLPDALHHKDYSGWQSKHPIVGSVGRLEVQKGYQYLVEAIPKVIEQFPDLQLWLIGGGPLLNELKKQCETLVISENVIFWGTQNKVQEFLSKMDIFVSSSVYEGLPTVVLEAMMYGIPCVVTDIPGTRELNQGKNVISVPAQDCQALSHAIINVLCSASLRETLTHNAWQTVNRFRIEKITQKYMDVYRKL
jgi:glycosyltransferase involved in cell wall biosynthesis